MSHVNTTPHYGLPIYGENDIINPLTDFNDANSAIDTALYEIADAQGSEAGEISAINTFLGDKELDTVAQNVTDAVNEVNTAVGNADTAIGNVAGDVVTLQGAVGDANTGLIHDVSSLQTTVGSQGNSITAIQLDVGALQGSMVTAKSDINDIKIALQGLDGEDVAYDGTTSGLSATNVQSAIDEVVSEMPTPAHYTTLASVTADGVKTFGTLLSELWAQITDKSVFNASLAYVEDNEGISPCIQYNSAGLMFSRTYISSSDNAVNVIDVRIGTTNSKKQISGAVTGAADVTAVAPPNGKVLSIVCIV